MMRRATAIGSIVAWVVTSSGCASTNPTQARDEVGALVEARAGVQGVIDGDADQDHAAAVRQRVEALLVEPLTAERAATIALLNSPQLASTLQTLGVAQADLVEAGLLDNPVVGGDLAISTRGNGLGGGLALSQSLLSAFLIPAKRRVAKARLQQAVVMVADAALQLARDVRVAVAQVQATSASLQLHRTLVQTAEVADELAQRQIEAGNITERTREEIATQLDVARLELHTHTLHHVEAREQINRLLGLYGEQISWRLAVPLAEPPRDEVSLERLETTGVAQRLDLSAARFEVESMQYALQLRRRGLIPQIDAGVEARNEVGDDLGHEWVVGPSLSIELPIFNPGHADFARLRSQVRQAELSLQARAVDARSRIRTRRQALVTSRERALYFRDVVLPRRQRLGQLALEQYNGMLIGAYELLETRAEQIAAQTEYVHALRDYWIARADLERAVGGQLPPASG